MTCSSTFKFTALKHSRVGRNRGTGAVVIGLIKAAILIVSGLFG